jgi:hypothetical protein
VFEFEALGKHAGELGILRQAGLQTYWLEAFSFLKYVRHGLPVIGAVGQRIVIKHNIRIAGQAKYTLLGDVVFGKYVG